jgi:hypothetical protein
MSKIDATTLDWSWKVEDSYSTFYSVISALCSAVTLILIGANRIKTTAKVKKYAIAVLSSSLIMHTFYYIMAYREWDNGKANEIISRLYELTGKLILN